MQKPSSSFIALISFKVAIRPEPWMLDWKRLVTAPMIRPIGSERIGSTGSHSEKLNGPW